MFKKGMIPWNKGTHIQTNTGKTHFKKGSHPSSKTEFKKGFSPWITGKHHTKKTKETLRNKRLGQKIHSEKWKKELSKKMMGNKHSVGKNIGAKNHLWKGGISKNKKYVSWSKNSRNRKKRKADGSHTFGEWELLKKQYGYMCPCCGKSEPEISLTEDHIIPLSKGGSDYIENIQPLCMHCNFVKHTKIIKY